MSVYDLPALNAVLNTTSALFLTTGYIFIKRGRVSAHRFCMLGAFIVSACFLVSYLTYHYHVGSVPFAGQGVIRKVYFIILITHTAMAIVVVPLVLRTLWLAWKERFEVHRRMARWTLPIWIYVSLTGVIVYLMLYRI